MCRRPRSSAPRPPTAEPVALSASASERRDARRIAGIAASAGPISPTARLIASIVAVDVEPRRDAVEAGAEERDDQVGEHDAQPRSEHGSERSEQERGAAVDPLDLPARRADRLHRRDLLRLLADQRRHRVREQHERGEQRQEGDHRHDRRDLPEQLLARIVAARADLGIVRKAGEALHRAQLHLRPPRPCAPQRAGWCRAGASRASCSRRFRSARSASSGSCRTPRSRRRRRSGRRRDTGLDRSRAASGPCRRPRSRVPERRPRRRTCPSRRSACRSGPCRWTVPSRT